MVVTREPKFIFLCTLTCLKCRTWYYFKCNLFSKILEFVRTGEYSPMFPLPSANTIIIENISVYKHWRHIRSRAQNHWCVWLAVALSSWSSPLLTDEFPTQFSVSILGFPLTFNSVALSWSSNFPPGFRMKSNIYVKPQSFEVRKF